MVKKIPPRAEQLRAGERRENYYFIESDGTPVLLEVNTTPGMTATSFIPQQIRAAGLVPGKVLEGIIDFLYHRSRR